MLLNTWELVNTWNIPKVVSDEQPSGGYTEFWDKFAEELERRKEEKRLRLKRKRKAKKIADKLTRELYLEERKIEEEEARRAELARINRLAAQNQELISGTSERMRYVLAEALERQTYSTMERLERELAKMREEEDFLLMAAQIIMEAV
jgi:anion-transporting  ArsA/GET3 family ATPase